jgi:hypothetical protein
MPSRGFQSSVDYTLSIGLGSNTSIDSIIIKWPNNSHQKIVQQLKIDRLNVIKQPLLGDKSLFQYVNNVIKQKPLLTKTTLKFDKHQQPDYTDFYAERGIPEMLSHMGPKVAIGDVNGDALEDIYVAGTSEHIGQLYLQISNGFKKKEIKEMSQFANFEDAELAFVDVDGDHDLDLFIASAGNNALPRSRELQNRLFINDGKGNFKINTIAFPINQDNIGAIQWCDFDKDGDLDLFTGASSVSRSYGIIPQSHVYLNNGKGQFSDLPVDKMAGLDRIGMIRSATLLNINYNPALVVVGEWMSPHIYTYMSGTFKEIKSNLNQLNGWWTAVKVADLNKDGKQDLVLGNIGENFNLHPTMDEPLKLFVSDFDGNGSIDKIMTKTYEKRDVPVFMKRDIQDQIPSLKKVALHHDEYAKKSINELFSSEVLDKSAVTKVNYTSSIVALNNGNGQFEIRVLPAMVQFSSIHAIHFNDFNKDGNLDLILGGNDFYFQPQLGRLDANHGLILLGDGKGLFNSLSADKTGLNLNGMVRAIEKINFQQKPHWLILQNDMEPQLYKQQ